MSGAEALGWSILELLGHIRVSGYITEEERFGTKMGRIDIHAADGTITTQYFSGASVYRCTPTTESIAKAISTRQPEVVHPWELRALPEVKAEQHVWEGVVGDERDDDQDDEPPF